MQDADISLINVAPSSTVAGVSFAAVAAALDAHDIDLDRAVAPRPLVHLPHCAEFALASSAGELRLRVPLRASVAASAADLDRERRVLEALHERVDVMPRPLVFHAAEASDEPPFAIFAGAAGDPVIDFAGLGDEASCEALVAAIAHALKGLYDADGESLQTAGLASGKGFVRRVLAGWRKRADLVTEHTPPGALMELVDWVEDMGVSDREILLPVHNSLGLHRMLVEVRSPKSKRTKAAARPVVTSVLDWGACTLGDPLIDLGSLLVGWPSSSDPQELLALDYVMSTPPALDREALAALYAESVGVSLDDLPFYRVIGLMRAAVHELKRFARVRRGLEPGIDGLDHAEVSECLLDLAMDVSMGRAF